MASLGLREFPGLLEGLRVSPGLLGGGLRESLGLLGDLGSL